MARPAGLRTDWVLPSITAVLSCTAAGLAAMLAYSLLFPFKAPRIQADTRTLPVAVARDEESRGPDQAFKEDIFSRKKLFDCADVKEKAPVPAGADGNAEEIPLALLGISLGDKKLALIRGETDKRTYYVSEGESVAGFEVVSIGREKVILRAGDKTLELLK